MANSDGRVGVLAVSAPQSVKIVREIVNGAGYEFATCDSFDPARPHRAMPEDEVRALLERSDVAYLAGSQNKINDRTLPEDASRLRGVVSSSLGFNAIDVDACTARGILVANAPAYTNYEGVFQHTVLLILAAVRHLAQAQAAARVGGGWSMASESADRINLIPELDAPLGPQKTLGVVGLGRIGYRVARLFKNAFGMHVVVYDPYVADERAAEIGAVMVDDLREMLSRADVVTIHCPLSPETKYMLGEAEFAAMKPTAYFVNTARGAIIQEPALIAALQNKQLAGAALDVTEVEPLPVDNPLFQMENVIVTPHVSGGSLAHKRFATEFAAGNALRLLAGKVPKGLVNPVAIPAWAERFGFTGIRHGGVVQTRIP